MDSSASSSGISLPRPGEELHLPPLGELTAEARVVSVPLRVRFRGVEHREALLLRGPAGWGEFCPFLEYGPAESSRWLSAAVEAAWLGFPEPRRAAVAVNATVPAVAAERVPEVLDGCRGRIREVKIKVAEKGQTLRDDLARVAAVAEHCPEASLKMDANGGWNHEQALEAVRALADFSPVYVEQPVMTIEGLAALRRALREEGVRVPIAADESVRKESDPLRVARAGAADLLVVKAAPLGGVRNALRVVAAAGLPAVVSSALETSVGMAAGLALAAALPELPHACGLGTASLLAGDVVADPLVPEDGMLPVGRTQPEEELLRRWEVPSECRDWWLQRLWDAYREAAPTAGG